MITLNRSAVVNRAVPWMMVLVSALSSVSAQVPSAPAATNAVQLEDAVASAKSNAEPAVARTEQSTPARPDRSNKEEVVFGRDVVVPAGTTVREVVVVAGSAVIQGKVKQDVVVCGGHANITGQIGGDLVVLGAIDLATNATVKGDAVVLGAITIATNATVGGDVVGVGGRVDIMDAHSVGGDIVKVNLGDLSAPAWLKLWFTECVFKLRPLSFKVGWVWGVTAMSYLLYLLVAVLFPGSVRSCVSELTRRPATTFLMGLLTKLLVPIILMILIATGLGVFVIPFIMAALIVVGLLGKVALLEYVGFRLGGALGASGLKSPVLALFVGMLLLTALYLVPVLGFLTLAISGMWGLGAAVTAAFGGVRSEMPEKPGPGLSHAPETFPAGSQSYPQAGTAASSQSASGTMTAVQNPSVIAPAGAESASYPTASFWERMGAGFLDVVLVGIVSSFVGGMPLGFLVALAYFAGMWTWKGTTIGGIVLGLKLVRGDGRPVTFAVGLVRSLAAAFSIVVLFLGFLWIIWDPEKKSWHDKIAGTLVVRVPKSMPLVVL